MILRPVLCSQRLLIATAAFALALASACTDTREAPAGRGSIRAIHAIPDAGDVSFQIEARALERPDYLDVTEYFDFDSLTYDFNFDYRSGLTGNVDRLATTEISVEPDTEYTLILTGSLAAPRIVRYEQPDFVPTGNNDSVTAWAINLSDAAGTMDLYIGAPGFDPASVAPDAAAVARDAIVSIGEIAAEEIQVVATPAGDPATVLIRTEPATLVGDDRVLFTLLDTADEYTAPHVVLLTGEAGSVQLLDDSAPVRLQFVHASATAGALDVYHEPEGGPLTTPLFPNVPVGAVSPPDELSAADDLAPVDVTVTPAGSPGTILFEQALVFADARPTLELFSGTQADGTLQIVPQLISRRRITDSARLSLYNAIAEQGLVDLYLLEPGDTFDRATTPPFGNNAPLGQTVDQFRIDPGVYTFYVVRDSDDTVLLGPVDVDLTAGDVVHLVTTDTADPNVSALIEIDLTIF